MHGLERVHSIVWIPEVGSPSPNPGFVFSIHVTLGELLNLSKLQFPSVCRMGVIVLSP